MDAREPLRERNDSPPSIFLLLQGPDARGPVPRITASLTNALRALGCTVATHEWGQRKPGESLLEKLVRRPRDIFSARRALGELDVDVTVVHTSHDWRTLLRDVPLALLLKRRSGTMVLHLHGSNASSLVRPGRRAFKLATRLLVRLVDAVLVLSTEEQDQWQSFCPELDVRTVKNPYERDRRGGTGRSSVVDRLPGRVLFVGRLIRAKGVFDLAEALPHVLDASRCHLVFVGEGDDEEELRDTVRRLHLETHVTFAGYLTARPLWEQYRRAAIFALPTRDEGFPTVLSEAMDAGLPIVTTRIRGAADHLVDGEHALFVEPSDVRAIASAIVKLLHDPALRAHMSAANLERVGMFEPKLVAAEYLGVLESILRRAGGRSSRRRPARSDHAA